MVQKIYFIKMMFISTVRGIVDSPCIWNMRQEYSNVATFGIQNETMLSLCLLIVDNGTWTYAHFAVIPMAH
jgi:hypothetical protein